MHTHPPITALQNARYHPIAGPQRDSSLLDKLPTSTARAHGMLDTGQTHIHHDEYKDDAS